MFQEEITYMLKLRQKLNVDIDINWRARQFEWHKAVWLELDGLKQKFIDGDKDCVINAVADIWHLGLSQTIEHSKSYDMSGLAFRASAEYRLTDAEDGHLDPFFNIECCCKNAMEYPDRFDIPMIKCLMYALGVSFEEMYVQFISAESHNRAEILGVHRDD